MPADPSHPAPFFPTLQTPGEVRRRRQTSLGHRVVALSVAALVLLGLGLPAAHAQRPNSPAAAAASTPAASLGTPRSITPRGPLLAEEQAQIDVFRRLAPSVVHITTIAQQRDMFSRNVRSVPSGTGSGFIWDAAGHIVTNFHVIQSANGAQVTLHDQTTLPARLVGAYPDRDLAVLRIDAPAARLAPIPIGTSKDLLVGQKVYAIGNPFGLDQTLTTGIVSALNREIDSANERRIRGVIQTDAAINPGNSGGPLLDSAGRLIGVNTAIYSPSGASAGIGFAIPVDEVNRIVPRLIRDGRFTRPALGLTAAPENLQRALKVPQGVAIVAVAPDSPGARAGLKPFVRERGGRVIGGDVVTAIDGQKVADLDDLLDVLEGRQAGQSVRLEVWRDGRTRTVTATLGAGND